MQLRTPNPRSEEILSAHGPATHLDRDDDEVGKYRIARSFICLNFCTLFLSAHESAGQPRRSVVTHLPTQRDCAIRRSPLRFSLPKLALIYETYVLHSDNTTSLHKDRSGLDFAGHRFNHSSDARC